jgi:hypothetical protein
MPLAGRRLWSFSSERSPSDFDSCISLLVYFVNALNYHAKVVFEYCDSRIRGLEMMNARFVRSIAMAALTIACALSCAPNTAHAQSWRQQATIPRAVVAGSISFPSSVAVSGDTLILGDRGDDFSAVDAGAAFVFDRSRANGNWNDSTKILPEDGAREDAFGVASAISGDFAVVGGCMCDLYGPGFARILQRNQGGPNAWGQVARLEPHGDENERLFGFTVAISNDVVVVGASYDESPFKGAAYVYERDHGGPNQWGLVDRLTAPDGDFFDGFGRSVAVSGSTIVVGAPFSDDSGAMYVFERGASPLLEVQAAVAASTSTPPPNTLWHFAAKIEPTSPEHAFGITVGIDDAIVAGAYGAAYVFERDSVAPSGWKGVAVFEDETASDDNLFGTSVAIDGGTIVVGAMLDDEHGVNAGAAYVFMKDCGGNTWCETAKLSPHDPLTATGFGDSVAISGSTIVVGRNNAAYVFVPEPASLQCLFVGALCAGLLRCIKRK